MVRDGVRVFRPAYLVLQIDAFGTFCLFVESAQFESAKKNNNNMRTITTTSECVVFTGYELEWNVLSYHEYKQLIRLE